MSQKWRVLRNKTDKNRELNIDNDVIYQNKADKDTIVILTKRFNPKKSIQRDL